MARRPTHSRPQRPAHTVAEKQQCIARLERRIAEVESFDLTTLRKRDDPRLTKLETAILDTLTHVFGAGTNEFLRYSSAARLDDGPFMVESDWITARHGPSYRDEAREAQMYVKDGIEKSLALLKQAVETLNEEIELAGPVGSSSEEPSTMLLSRRVFVVHGHDDGAREAAARYLERLGFEPIILHEQANQGRTVIEKVEAHGDVSFAVVLLTPDDDGCKKGEALEPRARQNVLLELGYFIGRLGRAKVCALMRGQVSIPSDFAGIVWQSMDDGGGWKQALARELQAAGHEIDWNRVMRP